MTSKLRAALAGSLAGGATILCAAAASAAPHCPASVSFFGTVERVQGNQLTVRTPTGHWALVRLESGARVNANGYRLRPGAYIGAYGCVAASGVFDANEVTLSSGRSRYSERLTGVVQRVRNGSLVVRESNGQYGTWYTADSEDFRDGQAVSGVGMLGSNGTFYPQSIDGRTVAYDTDRTAAPGERSIVLSGTVQRVSAGNAIVVWEPSRHTSGTWIVGDAGRFHAGERVTATGTQGPSGRFYVQRITIL